MMPQSLWVDRLNNFSQSRMQEMVQLQQVAGQHDLDHADGKFDFYGAFGLRGGPDSLAKPSKLAQRGHKDYMMDYNEAPVFDSLEDQLIEGIDSNGDAQINQKHRMRQNDDNEIMLYERHFGGSNLLLADG